MYIIWKDPNDDSQVAFPATIFATRIFSGKGQKREKGREKGFVRTKQKMGRKFG